MNLRCILHKDCAVGSVCNNSMVFKMSGNRKIRSMKFRWPITLFGIAIGVGIVLQSTQPVSATTIRDAVQMAIQTNPDVGIVIESKRAVEEEVATIRTEAQRTLNEKRAELGQLEASIESDRDRVTRTEVLSPVKGVIKALNVNTIGGVVQPGQDLVEIVPLDDNLLIEAKIKPSDRAQLRPNLDATIKITAYDFSIHGGLPARLIDISPDTIVDEEGNSFYRIRLRSDKNNLGKDKPIIPGMTASVDILTGQKTVLDYLMKPILKARQNALTER